MALPTFSILTLPAPGASQPGAPSTDQQGAGSPIVATPPTASQGGSSPVAPAQRRLDWRWVAALLFLWLALTTLYELGLPSLANGFGLVIAGSAVFFLGPAAIHEIVTLIGAQGGT